MSLRWVRPSRPRRETALGRLRVAAIVDEFTEACLEPDVTLLSLDARLWRAQLPLFRPELLFVESAWRGVNDSWRLRIAGYPGKSDETLEEVVAWCRRRGVPTVFWNKEDPVHFERFIERARLFDQVFTTDESCLGEYRRRLGREARVLPFAAQPALHHPGTGAREKVVCFAGSYGDAALAERRRDLELLLDAATAFELIILDRHSRARHGFPPRFARYLRDGVGYRQLAALQRRYQVFLNVNSVRDSKSMFSRRVFELLASGALVVSNPSAGIAEMFGDVVAQVDTPQAAGEAIRAALQGEREAARRRGLELVREAHTYEHRLRAVCGALGLKVGTSG